MIYFIQDSLTFRIKIGFTGKDDATERLRELQTGSSSLLYLLATRPGTKKTEEYLHEQFKQYRQQGEWFDPGPHLLQYVVGCSAVEMARKAVAVAAADLNKQSFPETNAEISRREDDCKAKDLLRRFRAEGTRFYLEEGWPRAWPPGRFSGDDSIAWECYRENVVDILQAEVAEHRAESPPSPLERRLWECWKQVLASVPPLWRAQLEKIHALNCLDDSTLVLDFFHFDEGTAVYCTDPRLIEAVTKQVRLALGDGWNVKVSRGGKIVERKPVVARP